MSLQDKVGARNRVKTVALAWGNGRMHGLVTVFWIGLALVLAPVDEQDGLPREGYVENPLRGDVHDTVGS